MNYRDECHLSIQRNGVKQYVASRFTKFGDTDVFLTTTKNKKTDVLINYKGHMFINGREVRLSRDHRVYLPNQSSSFPVVLQTCYDAAVEYRKSFDVKRVTLNKGLHRSLWRNNPTLRVRNDVRNLISSVSNLHHDGIFHLKGGRRQHCPRREERERLISLLYALNDGSIQSAHNYEQMYHSIQESYEDMVVLKRALHSFCEEAIELNLKEGYAAKDAEKVKEGLTSLAEEKNMLKEKLRQMENGFKIMQKDLDEQNASKDSLIAEQTRRIQELEKINRQKDREIKEKQIIINLRKNKADVTENCKQGLKGIVGDVKDITNDFSKFVIVRQVNDIGKLNDSSHTLQLDNRKQSNYDVLSNTENKFKSALSEGDTLLSELKTACKNLSNFHENSCQYSGNAYTVTTDWEWLHILRQQIAELSKLCCVPGDTTHSVVIGDMRPLMSVKLDHQSASGETNEMHRMPSKIRDVKLQSAEKMREKVLILARKTRMYREELAMVTTGRNKLRKQKKYLAEMVHASVKDRETLVSQIIGLTGYTKNDGSGLSCLENKLRHLIISNQELELKIFDKQKAIVKERRESHGQE